MIWCIIYLSTVNQVERETGLEPATSCLASKCSTNWATPAYSYFTSSVKCASIIPRMMLRAIIAPTLMSLSFQRKRHFVVAISPDVVTITEQTLVRAVVITMFSFHWFSRTYSWIALRIHHLRFSWTLGDVRILVEQSPRVSSNEEVPEKSAKGHLIPNNRNNVS